MGGCLSKQLATVLHVSGAGEGGGWRGGGLYTQTASHCIACEWCWEGGVGGCTSKQQATVLHVSGAWWGVEGPNSKPLYCV